MTRTISYMAVDIISNFTLSFL